MRNNSGFTLVELIIAVVIVGVLTSIAIPNYFRAVERAKIANGISIMKQIREAQIDYGTETGNLGTLAQLSTHVGANFAAANSSWGFAIAGTVDAYTVTATRDGGAEDLGTLIVNQNGVWGGGTYAVANYGMDDFN